MQHGRATEKPVSPPATGTPPQRSLPAEGLPRASVSPDALPVVHSDQLLPDGMLIIRHNDENYCLRVTRNGKLILTK
ncbi:MAG: hemin uptake protein HemP [Marinobacterium sp.]|nr:hemin uptake protein HemP [Marinobacterium sp.]